jgi:hypothetical protein
MAGLVPAIHVFIAGETEDVDARHKAGHDDVIIDLSLAFRWDTAPRPSFPSRRYQIPSCKVAAPCL